MGETIDQGADKGETMCSALEKGKEEQVGML